MGGINLNSQIASTGSKIHRQRSSRLTLKNRFSGPIQISDPRIK